LLSKVKAMSASDAPHALSQHCNVGKTGKITINCIGKEEEIS
jgi:hypothetical protein